jgi:hypothetical protein
VVARRGDLGRAQIGSIANSLRQAATKATSSLVERCVPRRSYFSVSSANQRSTCHQGTELTWNLEQAFLVPPAGIEPATPGLGNPPKA